MSVAFAWGLCHSLLVAGWNREDNLGVSELDLAVYRIFKKKVHLTLAWN
jgi:hypothetical protein